MSISISTDGIITEPVDISIVYNGIQLEGTIDKIYKLEGMIEKYYQLIGYIRCE